MKDVLACMDITERIPGYYPQTFIVEKEAEPGKTCLSPPTVDNLVKKPGFLQ